MYDFQNLSFDDFERLSCDLLQEALQVQLESFKTGRDGGVDLRYAPSSDRSIIVQCKRYSPTAFSRLLRDIQQKEKPKLDKLKPTRYVLSTSCGLSPDNKQKLMEALAPYCKSTGDIFGASELNAFLRAHNDIERRHFKLWLGSTAVLHQVLHAGIFNYSAHEVERLRREISKYVIHAGFYRALELLDETHHCIIVGIPGIGKTIAARLLLAHYLREGFEVVSVTGDIEEAWKVINRTEPDSKVVVYYDDFLGQMTFEQKLNKNEDRRLLDLMEHCRASKNTRFVLTTRDYLFDQALAAYEPLGRAESKLHCSSVKLDDYGILVRAQLLANHLQFSEVGIVALQTLILSRSYRDIIKHRNFLPRVIEQICEQWTSSPAVSIDFASRAIETLNDPIAVWRRPFKQLSFEARLLVYALASLKGSRESTRLEITWKALYRYLRHSTDRLYSEVLRETEGTFTHSQIYEPLAISQKSGTIVSFINPSAREFAHYDLIEKPDMLEAVLNSASAFDQLIFWKDSFPSPAQRTITNKIQPFADAIAERALGLLPLTDPSVSYSHRGLKIIWNPAVTEVTRLYLLFQSFNIMEREDLIQVVVENMFSKNPSKFADLMNPNDLTWLPEVLKPVLAGIRPTNQTEEQDICKVLRMEKWMELPQDMRRLRYVWDAADLVLQNIDDEYWPNVMRDSLIKRVQELSGEVSESMAADEISEIAEDLEALISEVDGIADHLKLDLINLRDKEHAAKTAEELAKASETEVVLAYGSTDRKESDEAVDEIFDGLLRQTEECQPYEKR